MTMSGTEDVVTVQTNSPVNGAAGTAMQTRFNGNMPSNRATVQLMSTAAWSYHSVAGQVATDGFPVAANQSITLSFQDGDVFYVLGTAVVLHALVVGG
jgi:hypothetical protein